MNILVLLGKSGSGKDTTLNNLLKYLNGNYRNAILTTTREMREQESQGKPYNFITEKQFLSKIENGDLIEYRVYTTKFNNIEKEYYYGLEKESFKDGFNYLTINTIDGLEMLRKNLPNANIKSVYLTLDDETRELRAKSRGSFDEIEWNRRVITDNREFENADTICDIVIKNDIQEKVVNKICSYISKNNML